MCVHEASSPSCLLQLRVSNSSDGYLTIAEGVCDPTNVVTFDLTVRYTESRISVGVAGSDVVLSPPPSVPEIEQLVLTIGNIPGRYQPSSNTVMEATGMRLGDIFLPPAFSLFPFQKTCLLEKTCSSFRVTLCCPLQLQLVWQAVWYLAHYLERLSVSPQWTTQRTFSMASAPMLK